MKHFFAGIAGVMVAIIGMQIIWPRKVNLVHKDKYGNVVDPRTGKPI